jgi:hypothetical protein
MDEATGEAIARIIMGAVITPMSILAALFVFSLAWLDLGILGIVLVGIAGAVALLGPFGIASGVQQYREVKA